jgi:hypothetical protein
MSMNELAAKIAKQPIDALLDRVEWAEIDNPPGDTYPSELYATHEGILRIGDYTFRVYQLNNGMRVFNAEDIESFFGGLWE